MTGQVFCMINREQAVLLIHPRKYYKSIYRILLIFSLCVYMCASSLRCWDWEVVSQHFFTGGKNSIWGVAQTA